MEGIIQEYFINPIFERTGYNAVNTLTYAVIALVSLYLIWRFLKGKKYDFSGREFLLALVAFVLFGSTCRVVTDLSDAGAEMPAIFTYGYLTVTPGIYIVTAILFLSSLAVGRALKNGNFAFAAGIALWLPCAFLVAQHAIHLEFAALAVAIAAIGAFTAYFILEKATKERLGIYQKLAIFGQALDGAATFVVIDIFSKSTGKGYFEQHVLSAGIGTATPLGFFMFFLMKLSLSTLIVYFLSKEKMEKSDSALILLVVAIMGFAPGIRDMLRMLCGA